MGLIDMLIKEKWLKSPQIIDAFRNIARADFLPEKVKYLSELNEPISIGYGQTNSQPLTLAFMLELLAPLPGEKILDIGAGSGWTTALLAHIVSQGKSLSKGKVVAIERISELKKIGERNVAKYNFIKTGVAKFLCRNGEKGCEEDAPFDKIFVSAALSSKNIPLAWKKQLKNNGKIIVPVENALFVFIKKTESEFEEREYKGFAFVPFVVENGSA